MGHWPCWCTAHVPAAHRMVVMVMVMVMVVVIRIWW